MEQRTDKLDDAFLFGLASIGIIISFMLISIEKNDWTQIISAIPFLLLGILLPFIVGYLRGAIALNNITERIRGWIYFLIGTISYFAFFTVTKLRNIGIDYYSSEAIFLVIIALGVLITYAFLKWFKGIFKVQSRLSTYAFSATSLSAFIFSFISSLIVALLYDYRSKNILEIISLNPIELFFWVTIVLFSLLLLMVFEKASMYAVQHPLICRMNM